MPRWCRCSRSGRVGCGRRRKRARSATAASRVVARATGIARVDDPARPARTRGARRRCRRRGAAGRAAGGSGRPTLDPTLLRDLGRVGRADGARRSGVAAALDLQEHADVGRGAGGAGPSRSATRWSPSCCTRLGYSLQGNVKTREGRQHPDRDAQFRYIAAGACARRSGAGSRRSRSTRRRRNWSATSRMAGASGGRRRRPQRVRVHDFVIPRPPRGRQGDSLRRLRSAARRRLGQRRASTTTRPRFAVQAIRRWWQHMGRPRLSRAPVAADHRRRGRQQRRAPPALEVGAAAARRIAPGWRSRSVTSRRARASGTRSSIGCSRTSP